MRKNLSLLLLAFMAVLTVSAQDAIETPKYAVIDYPTSEKGITVSGTTGIGQSVRIHNNSDTQYGIKFANSYGVDKETNELTNENYATLSVYGGFKKGDVITIAGAFNNSDDTKKAAVDIFTVDADKKVTKLFTTEQFINGRMVADDPKEETFTLEDDADKLYLGRNGNTATFITKLKIEREGEAPAEENVEINFSEQGWNDGYWYSWVNKDDVRVEFGAGAEYNESSKSILVYNGNNLTVYAPNGKMISKLTFTFDEGYEATAECFEIGSYADGVWTGGDAVNEVLMENKKGSVIRIQKIVVSYTDVPYYLYRGWLGDMQYNPLYWNAETSAYEINVQPWMFSNYNGSEEFRFAISDVAKMPGKDDDQAVFDYSHRFTIGAGNKEITVGEAAELGNFGAANIVLKNKGNYTISVTKDKKVTVTERKLAYAKWEFEKDENGNAKFDEYGYLVKDSIVFRYDNKCGTGDYENEVSTSLRIPSWSNGNSRSRNTKKVVFDKSFAEFEPDNVSSLFFNKGSLETVEGFENLNMTNITNLSQLFMYCYALKEVDMSKLNTENVENMSNMFAYCNNLESVKLGFNTEKVYNMNNMFDNCKKLKELDLSSFNTENVTSMSAMFRECNTLKELDLTNFDTQKVYDFRYMFDGCSALEKLDVTSFDVSNATISDGLTCMFRNCAALKTLDVSGFNTQNVRGMYSMFQGCAKLEALDLSGFNTQNVGDMDYIFDGCAALKELDLMSFTKGGNCMFQNCTALEKIIVSSDFYNNSKGNYFDMFKGATSLKDYNANVVSGWDYDGNGVDAIAKYCTIVQRYNIGTLEAGKYMTYYIDGDVKLYNAADGVTLATVTGVSADEVKATVLTAAAAETPLLIYNGTEETQNIVLVTPYLKDDKVDDVKPYAGFQGTLNGQQMAGSSDDLDYYICNGEEFVWVMNSGSVYANRCWLEIDKKLADAQGAQRRAIVFGDSETTGISIATAEAEQNGNYYDLNGRQLQGKPAQKGLYILNGKKVVIK